MDKASDFGSEDCEFESRRGRITIFVFLVKYIIYYRIQTKLREGNVFTGVCHSVQGVRVGGSYMHGGRSVHSEKCGGR